MQITSVMLPQSLLGLLFVVGTYVSNMEKVVAETIPSQCPAFIILITH